MDYGDHQDQFISFQSNTHLSYLSITITLQKATSFSATGAYQTIPSDVMSIQMEETTSTYRFTYTTKGAIVLDPGKWIVGINITLEATGRVTSSDGYTITTSPTDVIFGNF